MNMRRLIFSMRGGRAEVGAPVVYNNDIWLDVLSSIA
ncbi:hypothetical protein BCCR75502_04695 [Burkholderia sola]|nr:hypothetical protein BCCR75388_04696 [Burkholderia cenocepacia]CAG2332399.1 hypothetical protein BCCR75384_04695 [Burkholderia cenocepacia]CAG2332423.1 hypothetical protein BCCR75386_04692 [Burkholderia cenocepacia]CAG2332459.1 hypothetical protein BCCR75387_04693 [Burkholderia cenocepacia]CAG2332467.1 hypothetical protein BCCR12632_04698 [Burkholderia cenocepacia]